MDSGFRRSDGSVISYAIALDTSTVFCLRWITYVDAPPAKLRGAAFAPFIGNLSESAGRLPAQE